MRIVEEATPKWTDIDMKKEEEKSSRQLYCQCDDFHQKIYHKIVQDKFLWFLWFVYVCFLWFLWFVENPHYHNLGYVKKIMPFKRDYKNTFIKFPHIHTNRFEQNANMCVSHFWLIKKIILKKQTRVLLFKDFYGKLKFSESGVFHHEMYCLADYGLHQRVCIVLQRFSSKSIM